MTVYPLCFVCLYFFVFCLSSQADVLLFVSDLLMNEPMICEATYEHNNITFETFIHHSVFLAKDG